MKLSLNGSFGSGPLDRYAAYTTPLPHILSSGVFSAINFAQEEAAMEQACRVDTSHILLGLIHTAYTEATDSVNARIFNRLNLRHSRVFDKTLNFSHLEAAKPRDIDTDSESQMTVAARRLFIRSAEVAQRYLSDEIEPEHVLLAMLKYENKSFSAYGTFIELGIDPNELKDLIEKEIASDILSELTF